MKLPLKFVIGILFLMGSQAQGQDISGRFYPEKQNYLVGKPIFVVLELTNISSKVLDLDDGHCSTRFEVQASWRRLSPTAPAMGVGSSCGATIAPWPPGLTIKRRFPLEGPFRLDSPGIYPMRGHYVACIEAFDEGPKPCKIEEIETDFEVSLSSAKVRERSQGQPQQNFQISLPRGIQSDQVQVIYLLTGAFGGYGMSARPESGGHEYTIPTVVEGKPADALKALVYAPGCQIAKISVAPLVASTRRADFSCHTSMTISFSGRIQSPEFLRAHDCEVEINLVAHWAMIFFGIIDGIVPTFRIARLRPNDDGSFRGQLPDFTRDVVANSVGKGDAALQFLVREKRTENILSFLQPADSKYKQFGDLRLQPAYPDEVIFQVR